MCLDIKHLRILTWLVKAADGENVVRLQVIVV
jgi:hypothetical protein